LPALLSSYAVGGVDYFGLFALGLRTADPLTEPLPPLLPAAPPLAPLPAPPPLPDEVGAGF
jgi:hypothetical protein